MVAQDQYVFVEVHDSRGGHDGMANGGHFGAFSALAVMPKVGVPITLAVFVVSDEDKGQYQTGHHLNMHQTIRTTVYAIDPTKILWACVQRGYDAQPALQGSSSSRSWEAIEGITGGPLIELQSFLEAYPIWVKANADPAAIWLERTAERLGKFDVVDAIRYANRKASKNRIHSAWEEVATLIGVTVKWNYSWTGVNSAPLKIALEVQKKFKDSWGLTGENAYRYTGTRPVHPGEAKGFYTLPSWDVKLHTLQQ